MAISHAHVHSQYVNNNYTCVKINQSVFISRMANYTGLCETNRNLLFHLLNISNQLLQE